MQAHMLKDEKRRRNRELFCVEEADFHAGLPWNRRGWLAGAAGQTIQPHLESFTWTGLCACVSVCVCVWLLCGEGCLLLLLFFIMFPESAVGKETRERERHERQVKEHGFRVKARRNEGRKGRQMRRWCVCVEARRWGVGVGG